MSTNRGLCAIVQAESLLYKLLGGLAVCRTCYGALRFVMENGANGCEIMVSENLELNEQVHEVQGLGQWKVRTPISLVGGPKKLDNFLQKPTEVVHNFVLKEKHLVGEGSNVMNCAHQNGW